MKMVKSIKMVTSIGGPGAVGLLTQLAEVETFQRAGSRQGKGQGIQNKKQGGLSQEGMESGQE